MGGGTQKQETTNSPPEWAKGLFKQSADEASKIYASGAGGQVYQGDTVAGLGDTTQAGISGVQNAAGAFSDPAYRNMLMSGTSSATNLADMASGKNLLSNPFFNEALQGQLDDTAAQVQSAFSGAGRYGSGANTNVLTNELGDIRSNALFNQYNQDLQNMLTANGQIDAANQNQLGLINQANNSNLNAQQAVVGAGQLQDEARQQQLNADLAKFTAEDMQPWTRLGLLQSAAAGAAGNYGTNTQTVSQPGNPLGMIGALGSLAFK